MQGFSTSIIGAVPYTTVRLALFDGLKAVYRKVPFFQELPSPQWVAMEVRVMRYHVLPSKRQGYTSLHPALWTPKTCQFKGPHEELGGSIVRMTRGHASEPAKETPGNPASLVVSSFTGWIEVHFSLAANM